jgi:hypothetical protein
MREDDRLPRFNRYSIPPREGTVECQFCPSWIKPEGIADHMRAKHPERLQVECGCVPGHRMLVTTSICADCGLTEEEVANGNNRPCRR